MPNDPIEIPRTPLDALIQHYPEVIDDLTESEFTSHQFILHLAQKFQRLYVEALFDYRDDGTPFRTLHSQLSAGLREFPELVEHIGETRSVDMFGQSGSCANWRKKSV